MIYVFVSCVKHLVSELITRFQKMRISPNKHQVKEQAERRSFINKSASVKIEETLERGRNQSLHLELNQ